MADIESPSVEDVRWEKRELWLGVPAFVLFVVGLFFNSAVDIRSKTGDEVVAYFEDNEGQMFAAFIAVALGVFCLLWFLGAARARLRRGGTGAERLAATGFGAGVAFCALLLAGRAAAGAPSGLFTFGFEEAELDPVSASLFTFLGYDLWALAGVAASVSVAALAVAGEVAGALPKWLVRAGYVAALLGLISVVFPYATLAVVMLWFGIVSWVLAGRST